MDLYIPLEQLNNMDTEYCLRCQKIRRLAFWQPTRNTPARLAVDKQWMKDPVKMQAFCDCSETLHEEDYNVLVTEGDLRAILAAIERRRASQEKPFCLQLHIEIGSDRKLLMKNTIEELRSNMIAEMFEKGDLGNF